MHYLSIIVHNQEDLLHSGTCLGPAAAKGEVTS